MISHMGAVGAGTASGVPVVRAVRTAIGTAPAAGMNTTTTPLGTYRHHQVGGCKAHGARCRGSTEYEGMSVGCRLPHI